MTFILLVSHLYVIKVKPLQMQSENRGIFIYFTPLQELEKKKKHILSTLKTRTLLF